MYINNEDYMRAIVGDISTNRTPISSLESSQNTYNNIDMMRLAEPTLRNIDLYPETYRKINPIVVNACKDLTIKLTKNSIEKIANEIYDKLEKENTISSNVLKDLIQILVLNQLS